MAKNIKRKSERSQAAEGVLQMPPEAEGISATLDEPTLTPEQHRILCKAYRMILSWPGDDAQPVVAVPDQDKHSSLPASERVLSVQVEN